MKIAMIGRALPRANYAGGVSGQIHLLATALARRGHGVTVFALNPPPGRVEYDYRPIPIPEALRTRSHAVLYLAPWWVSHLTLDDFDVVHAHGDDHFVRTQRPVVRTFYGAALAEARYSTRLRHQLYHLSMVPFERISEWRATAIVAISQVTQRYLTRRAAIIPCGYDATVFSPAGEKSSDPSILFVGDLGTRKRGDLLVQVFAKVVRAAIPTAELWMVTSQSVGGEGIRWFGRVPPAALVELYRRAWVFCFPSRYEGFGLPYLEAMASGTPVVATPNGAVEEVLDAGCAGRIVADGELGGELVRLLGDSDARDALTARGLLRARRYEITEVAGQYDALYQKVLGQG